MISCEEAFLVFSKWAEEHTQLRVDAELPSCRFSCFGFLSEAVFPMVRFRFLNSLDFIDFYLPQTTGFEYADPDSLRLKGEERIGVGADQKPVRYGTALCVVRNNGDGFKFVEVIAEG